MKSTYSIIGMYITTILFTTIIISGCNDEPTVAEKVEGMLVAVEWSKPIVTVDGVDQSSLYQDFNITFTKTTYTTTGGGPLWPASGTWKFTDETAKTIRLDDHIDVRINEISETNLEIAIQNDNTTFKSGRVNSVKGKCVFRLIKNNKK